MPRVHINTWVFSHHRLVRTNFHFRYLDWDQPAVCLMCFQSRVWKQSRRRRVGPRRRRRIPATPPTASRKFRTAIRRNVYPLLDKLHLNNLNEISLRIKPLSRWFPLTHLPELRGILWQKGRFCAGNCFLSNPPWRTQRREWL